MTRSIKRQYVAIVAAIALNCTTGVVAAPVEKCEMPQIIRFSMVPYGNVDESLKRYQPLLQRIEQVTGRPVAVVRPTSYSSVVEDLLGGGVDIAELGPATYVEAKNGDDRITAFATLEIREGIFQSKGFYYQSMLVVLQQSRYHDIASLKGARLALTDPASTSGSLSPRKYFTTQLSVPLENYFRSVSFSGSHVKSLLALAKGDFDAAFVSSAQLEAANTTGVLPASKVRVLWMSVPLPNDPIVYRGQLCEPLRKQIRTAFVGEGAGVSLFELLESRNATRFVPIDDSHYAGIRSLLKNTP